jgi:hypothetical protein
MSLSPEQAREALHDVEQTTRRSATVYGYESMAPFLILWGAIWVVAYGTNDLAPRAIGQWAWPVLGMVGWVASMFIGARRKGQSATDAGLWLRWFGVFVAYAVFAAGVGAIMRPTSDAQVGAFVPLIVALTYALTGIFFNATRLVIAGAAVAALTLGGYFYLPSHFMLWMAVVGGGALILAGVWMRRV